ncbi:Hypothetical predicted protein [Marmota monax]|uniref:Uncharacterized protein n=1 Tax=Marmota monax TaxID=9995 RepID=A0A5E4BV95_MARMO|nr:Hypothetical predicted protein [Marmota monax]
MKHTHTHTSKKRKKEKKEKEKEKKMAVPRLTGLLLWKKPCTAAAQKLSFSGHCVLCTMHLSLLAPWLLRAQVTFPLMTFPSCPYTQRDILPKVETSGDRQLLLGALLIAASCGEFHKTPVALIPTPGEGCPALFHPALSQASW